ncbi:MAG: Holliday junction branch migration DNA helicase RuvB, partial [Novosphingobium sp.]|nr:Holliday junction branch migration DNA helicase RuvB [Novosphingobium sp.]
MTDNPLLSSQRQPEDADAALRPKTLAEFVGQAAAKDNLSIFIESAKSRGEAM